MSRFDYTKFDEISLGRSNALKDMTCKLENMVNDQIDDPRSKSLAMTKLEEFHMWVGKGIRKDQLNRERISRENS